MIDQNTINNFVKKKYSFLGTNKFQEISRLVFEIVKKEDWSLSALENILPQDNLKFPELKKYLIKKRYPNSANKPETNKYYLPKLEINEEDKVDLDSVREIKPDNIFIEEAVKDSKLAERFKAKFPESNYQTIDSYKKYVKEHKFTIKDYNDRINNFFIIKENYDFFKKCPCSPKTVSCGYHIVNLGSGCAYDCSYCYLPEYINSFGITFPANIEDFFEQFKKYKQDIRLGSGEFTDSLLFDHITGYSVEIVKFFKDYPNSMFELKTKSTNIDLLLSIESSPNIVISWSVNPEKIVCENEFFASSNDERLDAAVKCADAEYKIGFHFDPIIYYEGWEDDYRQVVDRIFDLIDDKNIAWISLGTLRMSRELKKAIENRFPENKILDEELLLGYDNKLRYDRQLRVNIYRNMKEWIRKKSRDVYLYLCMEDKSVCQECEIFPFKSPK